MFRDGYLEIWVDKLGQVIARCWAEAESSLAELIALKHPNPPEELITELLQGESRHFVALASDSHKVDRAFLEDLEASDRVRATEITDIGPADSLLSPVPPRLAVSRQLCQSLKVC